MYLYAILGGFKGRLHAPGDVVYFLYAILGGFKESLHATVDLVYFLYALSYGCVIPCLLLQSGRWNDVACTELNTYICKMPKSHYPLPSVKPTVYGCPQVVEQNTHSKCVYVVLHTYAIVSSFANS